MRDPDGSDLAIYYEHPDWFGPLFEELDRRDLSYRKIRPGDELFEVGRNGVPFGTLFNRMSPSAHLRGHERGIFFAGHFLDHLEAQGVRTVNGARAFQIETSKLRQLALLDRIDLPYPRTRVVHAPERASRAARELDFPVVVKPNVGGSGAGITRFESSGELAEAVEEGRLDAGIDGTLLVQEYVEPKDGSIVRVEFLDRRFLYAIRVYPDGDDFNLCPADACRSTEGEVLERTACPADAEERGFRVEGYEPPDRIVEAVERIAWAAEIDVGGVEYVEDASTGGVHFYDINALSNFVADPQRVVGFDPWERLGAYLEGVVR